MRYHLFQKFFGKMVKIKEMSFLSTRGMTLMFGNCISKALLISLKKGTTGVQKIQNQLHYKHAPSSGEIFY